MTYALLIAGAYLLGAVPTSFLVAKWGARIDLRRHGSGNLGATNLYRVLGWRYAVPAGAVDMAKGFVPVFGIAMRLQDAVWLPLAVGVAATLGHVYPVYLGFKGGKGVATATGAALGLAPIPTLIGAGVWVAVLAGTGFVSIASLSGAVAFPVAVWMLMPAETTLLWAGLALAGFIVFTHRANLRRLVRGTESRFGRHREA